MIHWEIKNNIGLITFDSPRGNLLSIDDLYLLRDILEQKIEDVSALILTGKNRAFCTGIAVDEQNCLCSFKLLDELLLELYSIEKPVYIALSGHAIGAGFLFLCSADVIVAHYNDRMKFGLPEINLGLGIDNIMFSILSECLPFPLIKSLIYSGQYISSQKLADYGLVSFVDSDISLVDYCESSIYENCIAKDSFSFCKKILRRPVLEEITYYINNECYKELASLFVDRK